MEDGRITAVELPNQVFLRNACHSAVIAKKHVYHNVNKVQITQTFILIFDLIDIVIYVFLRYNGSILYIQIFDFLTISFVPAFIVRNPIKLLADIICI
jgi:hypothetical protein